MVVRFYVCHFSPKLGKLHFERPFLCTSMLLKEILPKDKRQAEEKKWRISERTLCATALFGGWPAGYWAMRRFRHKSATGAKQRCCRRAFVMNDGWDGRKYSYKHGFRGPQHASQFDFLERKENSFSTWTISIHFPILGHQS